MEQLFDTLSAISHTSFSIIINSLILGTALTLIIFALKKYLWHHLSNFRYFTWWVLLFCVLILPVVSVFFNVQQNSSKTSQSPPIIGLTETATVEPNSPSSLNNTSRSIENVISKKDRSTLPMGENKQTENSMAIKTDKNNNSILSLVIKSIPIFISLFWVAISILLFIRILFSYRSISSIKETAQKFDVSSFVLVHKALSKLALRRPVRFALSDAIASPMAAGFKNPMILLPTSIISKFSKEEIEIILLHELAHIKRFDDLSKLGQRLVEALTFFHPVVHWISRQLDLEREMACDKIVISQTGAPNEYAKCLTKIIEVAQGPPNVLVPGAYSTKKQIFKRFEEILMKKKKSSITRPLAISVIVAVLIIAGTLIQVTPVVAFPGKFVTYQEISDIFVPPVEKLTSEINEPEVTEIAASGIGGDSDEHDLTAVDGKKERGSLVTRLVDWTDDIFGISKGTMISVDDDGELSASWSNGRNRIRVRMDGDIEFTDDGNGIKSISDGGYFALYEKRGSRKIEIDIEPDLSGDLDIIYYENGDEIAFDENAQEWLADALQTLYYKTGLNADKRVAKMHAEGGVDAVLDDMYHIKSDYVYRIYMTELLTLAELTDAEYSRVMSMAEENIDSDYEKAELLIDLAPTIQHNPDLITDYVEVVKAIDSDYETRRVLSELSIDKNSDKELIRTVLGLTKNIDSDYEKAELMIDLGELCGDDPELSEEYIRSLKSIDSDYESRRVFSALGRNSKLTDASLKELIILSEQLDSDYERAEFLIDLISMTKANKARQLELISSVASIDSDYEKRRVLEELEFDCDNQTDLMHAKLEALLEVESDYERVQALLENAECASRNEKIQKTYLRALETVESDYEKKRALFELMKSKQLERKGVINILKMAGSIDSDYDKSEVLKLLAKYCRGDEELEELYLDVVDRMSSDYEMKELYYQLNRRQKDSQFD